MFPFIYSFSVTKDDDQVLKLVGDVNGDSKTIKDQKDETFEGAGLQILKKDSKGNTLSGAKFKIFIYSADDNIYTCC